MSTRWSPGSVEVRAMVRQPRRRTPRGKRCMEHVRDYTGGASYQF